jgi:hypothetical protein
MVSAETECLKEKIEPAVTTEFRKAVMSISAQEGALMSER